jgi:uncharacterized protein
MRNWEEQFENKIAGVATAEDPAHDLLHFKRVVAMAKKLCLEEKAKQEVVVPAAWLHDLVNVPKDSPLRSKASQMSADAAIEFLCSINYPKQFHEEIAHAIAGHSFSANLEVKTLEAKIVQDADRLDGLGAIGIARCFATAALMKRPFYRSQDPFCRDREADDRHFTVDHFYKKLFKTADTLKTKAGQAEGQRRVQVMKNYLVDLGLEIELV